MLTRADVRRLLAAHGLAPRKAHGQNFVVDPNTVRKVVRTAGVTAGDLVCEVGAGLGSLTLGLRAAGARVVAVEIDAGLVRALREVAADDPDVRIVHADALTLDWRSVVDHVPAKLVANLPYNVATPIVIETLSSGAFSSLLVMVQKEVGQRWVAGPGDPLYAGVSVKIRALADARITGAVSRAAFFPVPNVDSVTVRLAPRPWPLDVSRDRLFGVVEAGFGQRRKRLRNALATDDRRAPEVERALLAAGLDAGARAEELDLDAWARLARRL